MGTVRMLFALAVALNHGGGVFGYSMMNGQIAVQAFYVISGFLITHILLTKYDATPRGNWLFYSNRALRIFVPYWTILGVTTLVAAIVYWWFRWAFGAFGAIQYYAPLMTLETKAFLAFTNLFIVGQDLSLWLKFDAGSLRFALDALSKPPLVANFNVLTPAWTIALELMFYAIAPFLVRRSAVLIGVIVVASFILRYAAYGHGYYTAATAYRFFPFELGLFLAGTLSYRLYQLLRPQITLAVSTIITLLTVSFVLNYHQIMLWLAPMTFSPNWFFFAMVLTLPAMFDFARRLEWDRWTGELSYPIYLIHWPVQILVLQPGFPGLATGQWGTAFSLTLTVLLSVALVVLVAAPLDRWREARVQSRGLQEAAA